MQPNPEHYPPLPHLDDLPVTNYDLVAAGDQIPRRGNWLSRNIARFLMGLGGWQIVGQLPNLPKMIIIGAPHTSNWDGVWAVLMIFSMGLRIRWMVKKEFVVTPFKGIIRWLGGAPVDRQAPKGLVEQLTDQFRNQEQFLLVITPEGTRKKVDRWKTGFLRIALGAGVPVVLGLADYPKRKFGFGPVFYPTGDMDADVAYIQDFYRTVTPRHPDRYAETSLPGKG
jgi:1-acyl-sn-glycerol-3-phosphate acyltransferase